MEKKHSGLGIASFIISIVSSISTFMLIVIAGVMETSRSGGIDEESVGAVMVGLFILAFLFVSLVALGLGIAGLIQKDRKKVYAIIGTVFSALTFLGTTSLIIIGLIVG